MTSCTACAVLRWCLFGFGQSGVVEENITSYLQISVGAIVVGVLLPSVRCSLGSTNKILCNMDQKNGFCYISKA
jgi:hypothetical protein